MMLDDKDVTWMGATPILPKRRVRVGEKMCVRERGATNERELSYVVVTVDVEKSL